MRPAATRLLFTVLALGVVVSLVWYGIVLWSGYNKAPLPTEDHCSAVAGGRAVSVDPDQAHYAGIIAGVAAGRSLVPRAVSIAIATAYQESGIRNLDYGHADSIGLFQQRPSQGWGTVKQIMDPYYSSTRFYQALVRVKNWRTGDINDVAQAVQRSGYPEAYRRHVPNARALASSLTGQTPASLTCTVAKPGKADPDALADLLTSAFRNSLLVRRTGDGITITADDARLAWSAAHVAITNTGTYGVAKVSVGGRSWTHDPKAQAQWSGGFPGQDREVTVSFRR